MKEKISGIYCIENTINGKKYIGLSLNINDRIYTHRHKLNKNTHINDHLQSSWNKYKEENFKFYIIEKCEKDMLKKREIYYISKYKTNNRKFGYNKTSGGDGTKNKSEEVLEKMSINRTKNHIIKLDLNGNFVEKYRNCAKASLSVNGRIENIRNCCNKKYGSKSVYGYIWLYEKNYDEKNKYEYKIDVYTKPIIQYDTDMNFIAEYESARECERQTGIGYKMISRVCKGERPHTHGCIFRFKNI